VQKKNTLLKSKTQFKIQFIRITKEKTARSLGTKAAIFGLFEAFTKGIGSKLMIKMGYRVGDKLGKNKEVMPRNLETTNRPENIKNTNKVKDKTKSLFNQNFFCAEQSEIDYSSDKTRIIGKKDSFADYSKRSLSHCHFIPMYELKSSLEDVLYKISKRIIFIAKTIKHYLKKKKPKKSVKIKTKVISFQIIKNKNRYLSLKAALISLSDSSMLLTLEDIGSTHEELRKRFINEYLFFKLSLLAAWQSEPHIVKLVRDWKPLFASYTALHSLIRWIKLLQKNSYTAQFFYSLEIENSFVKLIFPQLTEIISIIWQVRDQKPIIRILEKWILVLTPSSVHQLISVIINKLQVAVNKWDPMKEKISIYKWINPWLPMLKDNMRVCIAKIRLKLTFVIKQWNTIDQSVLMMLNPWRPVWRNKHWDLFCAKNIVPKLKNRLITGFLINPIKQNFEIINSIIIWHGNLNNRLYAQVFSDAFFPQFILILKYWTSCTRSFDEISLWVAGWKVFFPQDLLDQEILSNHLMNIYQIIQRKLKSTNLKLDSKKI
jgi:hypothetical protein